MENIRQFQILPSTPSVERKIVDCTFDSAGGGDVFNEADHDSAAEFVLFSQLLVAGGHPVEGALKDIQRSGTIQPFATDDRRPAGTVAFDHFDRVE